MERHTVPGVLPVVLSAGILGIFPLSSSAGVGVVSSHGTVFYGGGISASFGTVDYVELSPMVGMWLDERTSVGISLLYRYRNDDRVGSSDDYGGSLFARYHIAPTFYLEGDYEYLDHEYRSNSFSGRRQYHSFLAGGGMSTPLGANTAMYLSALYNFSYEEDDSPYGDPWVVRFGISVGF